MRWLVVTAALVACDSRPERPAPAIVETAPRVDASAVLQKFECNRCHAGTGLANAPPDKHCVGCHRDIVAGRFPGPKETVARWRTKLISLRVVPSLVGANRLRRAWLEAFLLEPHDLRPTLPATMPRLAISKHEAAQIAAQLVPIELPDPAPFTQDEIAAGRALYEQHYCGACHRFTGAVAAAQVLDPRVEAQALAPDLAHARARLQRGAVAELIADPKRHKPDAQMPSFALSAADTRALAAFLLETPLAAEPSRAMPPRLPVLARTVTWAEVSENVFRFVCWHCHSTPEYALGDGGPGNSGGFGFAPRGLDLARHSGIMAGAFGADGRRRSVFAPTEDGTPLLVAVLLARQAEEAGRPSALRGMPLGLPALSPEQIQLVETWIAQGRKP